MQKVAGSLKQGKLRVLVSMAWMLASFMGIEVFMRHYVCQELIFPWLFSAVWAVLLTALVWLFPRWLGRLIYGLIYLDFNGNWDNVIAWAYLPTGKKDEDGANAS